MRLTNWYVITGAPCSGKTSVINDLARRNYKVVHEVARTYIKSELKKGKSLNQIKADESIFERHILLEKVKIEAGLAKDEIIFFDRGLPDSIAYYRLAGLNPAEPLCKCRNVRYKKIFLFERLIFLENSVRSEDEKTADKLGRLIEESYRLLGYDILHVPVCSVKERTQLILQRL
jgi:predicted ATPase